MKLLVLEKTLQVWLLWWHSDKELAVPMQETEKDAESILGSIRSPGGAQGSPLQYSCLGSPMDGGAWWATVHRVIKSQTRLKRLGMYTHTGETTEYHNPQSISEITGINFGQPKYRWPEALVSGKNHPACPGQ